MKSYLKRHDTLVSELLDPEAYFPYDKQIKPNSSDLVVINFNILFDTPIYFLVSYLF